MVNDELESWRAGELEIGRTMGFRPQRGSKPWILEMICPLIFANGAYFYVFFNWARWLTYFCPRITQINADFFRPLSINPFLFEKLASPDAIGRDRNDCGLFIR